MFIAADLVSLKIKLLNASDKIYLLFGGAVGGTKLSWPRLINSAVAVGAEVPI